MCWDCWYLAEFLVPSTRLQKQYGDDSSSSSSSGDNISDAITETASGALYNNVKYIKL